MQFVSLFAVMFENVAQTKIWRHICQSCQRSTRTDQAESEDSNDPDLDIELDSDGQIKSFIFEPQCGSSSQEEGEEEQELVIES